MAAIDKMHLQPVLLDRLHQRLPPNQRDRVLSPRQLRPNPAANGPGTHNNDLHGAGNSTLSALGLPATSSSGTGSRPG